MSNTAAPSRIDAPLLGEPENAATRAGLRLVRLVLGAAILSCLLVTFTPFVLEYSANQTSGNALNQFGYSALAAIAVAGHFLFTDRKVALSLLRPLWLLPLAMLLISATHSLWPDNAVRAVLFAIVAMIAATGALTLPASVRDFRVALMIASLAVLGLSYAGIVLDPAAAIHDGSGFEPQHAGLWRGIYSHKNVAGPVMAMLFFAGLYIMRSGDKAMGLLVAVLAAYFIHRTGSKSTLALVPVVAAIVIGGRALGGRMLPVAILALAIAVTGLLTLGSAISPQINDLLQSILPGTTFTGRLDLWRFTLGQLHAHPWSGFGFESFWDTPNVARAELPFELSWDPRGIVNSHSGYLDIAVWAGWPTLAAASIMLIVLPLKDYLTTQAGIENQRLADCFLMIVAFALLNSFLETYFFSRGNAIWLFTWVAMVGLRLGSRFRLA